VNVSPSFDIKNGILDARYISLKDRLELLWFNVTKERLKEEIHHAKVD
jgi:hypothetical protein